MPQKELLVVGGPNGAERPCAYLCADVIAKGFPHLDPVSQKVGAGREFLRRMEDQLTGDEDLVIETTLSGRTLQTYLHRAQVAGFSITIFFIYLDSADTCVARVRERVLGGGHNVPEDDIRRRFSRSLANFWQIYREIADYWYMVYNSTGDYRWVASGQPGAILVHDEIEYGRFLHLAGVNDVEIDD